MKEQLTAKISEAQRSIDRLLGEMANPAIDRDTKQYMRGTVSSFRRDISNARKSIWDLDQAIARQLEDEWKAKYQQDTIEPLTQPTSGTGYADSLRHRDLTA